MSLPHEGLDGDIPKPSYEEIVEAANKAMLQAAESKAMRGQEIDNPNAYLDALIDRFMKRESWWKVHRLLGNLPIESPELPAARSVTPNISEGMRVTNPDGSRVWLTKESVRRAQLDHEEENGSVRVREPVDWLQKSSPRAYACLREIVSRQAATTRDLLQEARIATETKWKRFLGERRDDGTRHDPKGFTKRPVFLMDLNQAFRDVVLKKYGELRS